MSFEVTSTCMNDNNLENDINQEENLSGPQNNKEQVETSSLELEKSKKTAKNKYHLGKYHYPHKICHHSQIRSRKTAVFRNYLA